MFFVQAEDGRRDLVRSRGLGDVYRRQVIEGYDEVLKDEGGEEEKAPEPASPVPETSAAGEPAQTEAPAVVP